MFTAHSDSEMDPPIDYDAYSDSIDDVNGHDALERRQSLRKSYDAVVFDVLKVSAEEFASQITILDLPVFKAIQPEELSGCSWTSKDKLTKAPNVVAFTRRFNQVNFWVQKEILNTSQSSKARSDVLAHFIKIAKKLLDMNNLHSVMAVLSALQSAPVFRLTKTWAQLPKKERSQYEKIAELFSESNNRQKLRDHMSSIKLPCIPYLGLYLSDLIYIDVAHPHSGGMESEPRKIKMNNILRIISEFQQSNYDNLKVLEHVQTYLKSHRYIEELQKFVEDDNYRLSLKVEPPPTTPDVTGVKSKSDSHTPSHEPSPIGKKLGGMGSVRGVKAMAISGNLFVPQHRKTKSLSASFTYDQRKSASLPNHFTQGASSLGQRNLIDDSVLEDSSMTTPEDGSEEGLDLTEKPERRTGCFLKIKQGVEDLPIDCYKAQYQCQGCLRRKTMLKQGRKPPYTQYTRYWVALWNTSLLYFPCKLFSGPEDRHREAYKSDPSKMVSIVGWMVVLGHNPDQPDAFQLTDPIKGNAYKFRTGSKEKALEWVRIIDKACKSDRNQIPENLMHFEDESSPQESDEVEESRL